MHQTKVTHDHKKKNHRVKPILEDIPEDNTDLDQNTVFGSDGSPLLKSDSNFEAELEYDGYEGIEQYDNDEYNSNVEGKGMNDRKLDLVDRFEKNKGQEDPLDTQENNRLEQSVRDSLSPRSTSRRH